jgi:hypothetical protein
MLVDTGWCWGCGLYLFVTEAARETACGQQEAGRLYNATAGVYARYPVATSPASYKAISPGQTTVAFNPDRISPNLFPVAA